MATAMLRQQSDQHMVPREHGATAMLLIPFVCTAILLRDYYWQEVVTLIAIIVTFAIKDPLIVMARQRFVWKQEHAETRSAKRSAVLGIPLLTACGAALALTRDWRMFGALFIGASLFTGLAVVITIQNRQRSVWFQILSAIALSSTCIAASLSAINSVPGWCWMLWCLCAAQATAGILVVHARLEARVAARKGSQSTAGTRTAAFLMQVVLVSSGACLFLTGRRMIGIALILVGGCYLAELRRQQNAASLQMPLQHVGQQALALSSFFAVMVVLGLW